MLNRSVFFLLVALAAMLISCSEKQKSTQETSPSSTEASQRTANISESDTALAGRYFNSARQLGRAAKYDSALIGFRQAVPLYEKAGDWEKYIFCRDLIGEVMSRKGEYEQAMTELQQALEVGLQKLGAQHERIGSLYNQIGGVHYYKGEYNLAKKFYIQSLEIRRAVLGEQNVAVAGSYGNLGNVYLNIGDYDQAFAYHLKALDIRLTATGERSIQTAIGYLNIGNIYYFKGDFERAIVDYNKSLSIWKSNFGEQPPQVATLYSNLGNIYCAQGDHDQAIAYYQKTLSIQLKLFGENHPAVAMQGYYNMALAYSDMGDYDQALHYLEKALAIELALQREKHTEVGQIYDSMGIAHNLKGEHDRALVYHQKALAIQLASLGEKNFDVSNIYLNQAAAYDKKGNFEQALALYHKALSIRSTILAEPNPHIAQIYQIMASSYEEKGLYDQALPVYQQALQANLKSPVSSDPCAALPAQGTLSENEYLKALAGKARTFSKQYAQRSHNLRDLEAAVSTYQLASQIIDQTRSSYKAEGSKLFLAKQATEIYDQAIQSALQLDHIKQDAEAKNAVFQFAEKSKAGIILESLAEAEARQFAGIPDSLFAKERQVRIDLAFYEKSLAEELSLGQKTDSAKVALWQDKVFGLKQAYDALLQQFEKEYPDYYNLKYQVKTVSVPEVQQLLDDKTALVEYFTGKDSIFILAITKADLTVKTSSKDSLFEQKIEQLHKGITQQDFNKYTQAAYHLYQALLSPVADQLNGNNLIIIPDGALSAIPFEALLTERVANSKLQEYAQLPYLVNEHAISYAYSATLLQQEQSRSNRQTKRDYLALAPIFAEGVRAGTRGADFFAENFGHDSSRTVARMREGYLPDTKREVTGILGRFKNSYGFFERWFGNKSRVYLEREATETRLKSKDIGEYRFLHFATHGLINEKNPKLSGLLLAQEDSTSKEDGILHLGEIYNLNLNADLVVLSACETGLGQIAKGEGIIGLTRGFLYAGAKNLLVSLWQVSDVTTADLMVDFYGQMLQGATKPEALAEAKRHLIRSGSERAKPDYWAPFILIGR